MDKHKFSENVLDAEQTLYRISKSILRNDASCEDAVSAAILKAWENLEKLKEEKLFKTWLVKILINECYSLLRKEKPTVDIEDYTHITAEENPEYSELYTAIESLSTPIRLVIVLYYIEEYSIEEIKTILKIPSGTVKSRLHSGRKSLKKYLTEECNYE